VRQQGHCSYQKYVPKSSTTQSSLREYREQSSQKKTPEPVG